ncbi:MAG: hypothetical protein AAGN15_21870 [Cyanobacteria bacterium J06581_3]
MANRLQNFQTWLLENRFFRVARFAKDPKYKPAPEEALAQLPDEIAEELMNALNDLPVAVKEESAILEELGRAIARWKDRPRVSQNSIVLLMDPVSSVSRILTTCLIKLRKQHDDATLSVNLLDWVERPADAKGIKEQIEQGFGIDVDAKDSHDYRLSTEKKSHANISVSSRVASEDEEKKDSPVGAKELMVIPNLSWCFLRSVSGLDGLDYIQDLLPSNHRRFWVMGSGIVGWEYLKSTLKFHAYCGDTFRIPALSGEDLQSWLAPVVAQFDIYFLDTTLPHRLQNIDDILTIDISADKPMEALSEITQEVSATVQASVNAVKDELVNNDDDEREDSSSERQYFQRLAELSDGVSTVALQLFIKSLRYKEVEVKTERPKTDGSNTNNTQPKVLIKDNDNAVADASHKSATKAVQESAVSHTDRSYAALSGKVGFRKEHRVIAITPKLPPLPELSQSDLYLLYSLILHGDLTIGALAESLGDAPNVVNNQVQLLRNEGVIEQKGSVLKANPAHYPQLRRELDKNNFIIEVPQ